MHIPILSDLGHFFKHVFSFVHSKEGRNNMSSQLARVQGYITEAMPIVTLIEEMTGGHKSVETAMQLVNKYGLQTVTPGILQDPVWIDQVFHNAAVKGLQLILPHATPLDINLAIELAVSALRANQSTANVPAAPVDPAPLPAPVPDPTAPAPVPLPEGNDNFPYPPLQPAPTSL